MSKLFAAVCSEGSTPYEDDEDRAFGESLPGYALPAGYVVKWRCLYGSFQGEITNPARWGWVGTCNVSRYSDVQAEIDQAIAG